MVRSMIQYTLFPFESEYWSHDAGVARGYRPARTSVANKNSPAGFSGSWFGSVRFAIALALAIAALAPLRSNPT